MSSFTRPLADGWRSFSTTVCNELTEKTKSFLRKYINADLIIVTGPTGAGKTSFLEDCTGINLGSTSSQNSGTRNTYLVPGVIHGKRYLFLDMPGFDANDLDDWQTFTKLMTAMATINQYVTFRGVVYVDPLQDDREKPGTCRILTWLKHFCGNEFMPNLTIITTWWDALNDEGIDEKLARYQSWSRRDLLRPLIQNGAETHHHGLVKNGNGWRTLSKKRNGAQRADQAHQIIHQRYHEANDRSLQIYKEIADGCSLERTTAGYWLKHGSVAHRNRSALAEDEGIRTQDIPDTAQNPRPGPSTSSGSQPQAQSSWSWSFSASDAMPWVKLLVEAAKYFTKINSSSNPATPDWDGFTFRYNADYKMDPTDFDFDEYHFEAEEPAGSGHTYADESTSAGSFCVVM